MTTVKMNGRLPATAKFGAAYIQLSQTDKSRLSETITNTCALTGRSLSFKLDQPIFVEGREVLALRCKGVSPILEQGGIIPEHRGSGFDSQPIAFGLDGRAFHPEPASNPQGTIMLERAERECLAAHLLGVDVSDIPFGMGFYDRLDFQGEKVGFVIFGMEDEGDRRLFHDYFRGLILKGLGKWALIGMAVAESDNELKRAFGDLGRQVAAMHRAGLAHGYLHLDNIGVVRGEEIRIRDLETARELGEMTGLQQAAYRLWDLATVVDRICEPSWFSSLSSMPDYLSLKFAIPVFAEGYFGREGFDLGALSLVFQLIKDGQGGKKILELASYFRDLRPVLRFLENDQIVPVNDLAGALLANPR